MGVRVPSVPIVAAGKDVAVVDKVTVLWLFKEVRLGELREGGRVAMVTGCVLRRSVVCFSVVFLVDVTAGLGEGC